MEVSSVPTENELFSAVDALLEDVAQDDLPSPEERKRLREAAGLSQEQIAKALKSRRETIGNWESGVTEPRPPKRAAYARLLEGLAARFPAPAADAHAAAPAPAVPETFTGPEPTPAPAPAAVPPPRPKAVASSAAKPAAASSRRPGAKKAVAKKTTAAAVDQRFENGPLAVIDADQDGQVSAYCVGGLVLDVPAKSIPSLVDWTLTEARLGQARLHRNGRDADPILVLTAAALERYGLPAALSEEERRHGRIADSHKVVKQIKRAASSSPSAASGRGRASTASPRVPSGAASSCASCRGTRWTPGSGTRRTTRSCRRCTRPTSPGTSACTRRG